MSIPKIPYLKSWFLFFLVSTLGGAIVGGIAGFILGFFLGMAGVTLGKVALITGVVGFFIGLPISFFVFKWSVRTYIVEPLLTQPAQQIAA